LAKEGSFRLRFRNYETVDIQHDADIYAVEKALEDLQSVGGATYQGDVTVEVTTGDPNCNQTACCAYNRTNGTSFHGNMLTVYFISELGNLPELVVSQDNLGPYGNGTGTHAKKVGGSGPVAIEVKTKQDGTTENAECSNRGICNRANGVCACFDGFGSSNGNGRHSIAGTRGDCGYVLPVFVPTAQ
jgi:hypothetical protein